MLAVIRTTMAMVMMIANNLSGTQAFTVERDRTLKTINLSANPMTGLLSEMLQDPITAGLNTVPFLR